MDTAYSLSLLFALMTGGLGAFLFICSLILRTTGRRFGNRMALVALSCVVIALFSGLVSACLHYLSGHGADAAEPMSVWRFFVFHKAYWLILLLALALLPSFARVISAHASKNQEKKQAPVKTLHDS